MKQNEFLILIQITYITKDLVISASYCILLINDSSSFHTVIAKEFEHSKQSTVKIQKIFLSITLYFEQKNLNIQNHC